MSGPHQALDGRIQTLRSSIKTMDQLSQRGLSQIEAVARVAAQSIERSGGEGRTGDLMQVLRVIADMALSTCDAISFEADEVGCGFVDEKHPSRPIGPGAEGRQEVAA